jgi:hypothetical protein
MADKNSFPQIPSTVWWGVRGILQKTPSATIDERYLGIHLGVQEAASRQYISELKRVGILGEDGKATPLAGRWRHDETYWAAAQEVIKTSYPAGLIQVAPPGEADRQRVISWFIREGLGTGTANNKTATYLLIGSKTPNESPSRSATTQQKAPSTKDQASKPKAALKPSRTPAPPERASEAWPLNIHIQIHISADANNEQTESTFSAMRRYLHDTRAS